MLPGVITSRVRGDGAAAAAAAAGWRGRTGWRPSPGWPSGASTPSAPPPTAAPIPSRSASGTGSLPNPNPPLLRDHRFALSNQIIRQFDPNPCRYLSVEKARYVYVRLFPEPGRVAKERPPLARFLLRACWSGPPRRSCVSPGTYTPLLSSFFLPPPPYLALGYGPSPF